MKDDLRYKYKIKRKYFQHSIREVADGCISDTFLEYFKDKQSFFIYYSFGSEADTHSLINNLLEMGKSVYLPRVEGENMVAVSYFGGELKKSSLGTDEPTGEQYNGDIDVVVCPLLAINSKGYRLGYGGGYYDRFLKNSNSIKVGLGYFLQLTDEFEEDSWDEPMHLFICERGVYKFGN
jgi:5-formyltetrahydrofolate cyclo-ligase